MVAAYFSLIRFDIQFILCRLSLHLDFEVKVVIVKIEVKVAIVKIEVKVAIVKNRNLV